MDEVSKNAIWREVIRKEDHMTSKSKLHDFQASRTILMTTKKLNGPQLMKDTLPSTSQTEIGFAQAAKSDFCSDILKLQAEQQMNGKKNCFETVHAEAYFKAKGKNPFSK
eukprot:TRINITY_DN773987_c0_g1_i1.p1 TRINITY_DN773987_c0_g1~~TRINITY_DN773987_c0_g1_i1.p1  ORF type:complete len:119 (-),score=29.46 TRINITY_DN773987_c0_g1_i1:98-427(-)